MGLSEAVEKQKQAAASAIDALGQAYDELHDAAGKLAFHQSKRPAVEREALPEVMAMPQPGTEKQWSMTGAKDNLDLSPKFKEWREQRNELEGFVRFGEGQIAVLARMADLELVMLRIAGEAT